MGVWPIVYTIYPPFLRMLEKVGIHNKRQDYHLGFLKENISLESIKSKLETQGFEPVILAWRDRDEALSMRKIHKTVFQHHIRVYTDGEVRAHYEYSSEGAPIKHIFENRFTPELDFFKQIMKDYLR